MAAFHRRDLFGIQGLGGTTSGVHDVALVKFQAHFSVDGFLGLGHQGLDGFTFRSKPEAVVNQRGVFRDEGIAHLLHFTVNRDRFNVAVGRQQDGAAGGFINAAALHAHEAVFHNVHAADAVLAAQGVQHIHDAQRAEQGVAVAFSLRGDVQFFQQGSQAVVLNADHIALFIQELDVFSLVRGVFRRNGKLVHFTVRGGGAVIPGIFQHPGFKGDVEQVAVHGIRLLQGLADRDAVGFRIGDHFRTARELLAEFRVAPRGDDLDVRGQRIHGQLKAHLVIPLACSAVGDGVRSFTDGQVHHVLGNAGTGDGSAQQVAAFIQGIGLHHGEDVVGGEVFLEVADEALGGSRSQGFGFQAIQFFRLAYVCAVGDDFGIVLFLEPLQKNGSVKAARVCNYDFHVRQ